MTDPKPVDDEPVVDWDDFGRASDLVVADQRPKNQLREAIPLSWGPRMVASGGPVGWGQLWCRARLTCHLGILRLMSRGLARSRRLGLSRPQSWAMACWRAWSVP